MLKRIGPITSSAEASQLTEAYTQKYFDSQKLVPSQLCVETHSQWATLERLHNYSVIFNNEGSVLLVINMSSPILKFPSSFWSQPTLKRFSKGPEVPCEAWLQLLASAPCHLRSVAGSFWSYPSLWGSPPQGLHAQELLLSLFLEEGTPEATLSFLSASLCYHALLPNIFFSIAGSSGTSPQAWKLSKHPINGGNAYSSSHRIHGREPCKV